MDLEELPLLVLGRQEWKEMNTGKFKKTKLYFKRNNLHEKYEKRKLISQSFPTSSKSS